MVVEHPICILSIHIYTHNIYENVLYIHIAWARTSFPTESPATSAKTRPSILAKISRTDKMGREMRPDSTVCQGDKENEGEKGELEFIDQTGRCVQLRDPFIRRVYSRVGSLYHKECTGYMHLLHR